MSEQPKGNGNTLRDYRIKQVEEAVLELKQHTRVLEDNLLKIQAGGITMKQLVAIMVSVLTTIGTLVAAYYQLIIK